MQGDFFLFHSLHQSASLELSKSTLQPSVGEKGQDNMLSH